VTTISINKLIVKLAGTNMGDEGEVTGRCYYRKQRFFAVSRGKVNTVNPLLPRIIINFMLQRWNSIRYRRSSTGAVACASSSSTAVWKSVELATIFRIDRQSIIFALTTPFLVPILPVCCENATAIFYSIWSTWHDVPFVVADYTVLESASRWRRDSSLKEATSGEVCLC